MENKIKKGLPLRDVALLLEHTAMDAPALERVLKEHKYADKAAWDQFIKLFFVVFGLGLTLSGLVFFFAYNWDDLPKFAKFALLGGLIIGSTLTAVYMRMATLYKNILLTASAVLVGVLFAVFGQVYQTGANAYDLFLTWFLAVSLWSLFTKFPPLWLLYALLANTVLILYFLQVTPGEEPYPLGIQLLLVNGIGLVLPQVFAFYKKGFQVPVWYTIVLESALVLIVTIGGCFKVFQTIGSRNNEHYAYSGLFIVLGLLLFAGFVIYGLKQRNVFPVAIVPVGLSTIFTCFLIRVMELDIDGFFLIGIVVLVLATLQVIGINNLQKKWQNEKQ